MSSGAVEPVGREPGHLSDERLAACPFCGGPATLDHGATDDFVVSCRSRRCFGPRTSPCAFSEDAIAMWNRRAAEQQEPYAHEFGRSNGDGTYSVIIQRGEPVNPVSDWPVKPLFTSPSPSTGERKDAGVTDDSGWFDLSGDARLGACATEGCGGQPTARLEAGGVGSNYCSGCATKIRARTALREASHD